MKITFILPGMSFSGGTKAVFLFANHLQEHKHDVCIIYPAIPLCTSAKRYDIIPALRRIKGTIRIFFPEPALDWFDLKADLRRVPFLSKRYIPQADVIVATWWETAYYVNRWGADKGKKFYLVQHYEIWGGPKEMVDNSYKLGLKNIVNSSWLKNILEKELNTKTEALILHAPDRDTFYPENSFNDRSENIIKILLPFRGTQWKGDEDGIKAFEIVKEKYPHVRLTMFGPIKRRNIPSYAEFYLKPSNSELRKIYNSCDIFVYPSRSEGFGMPPMEAMACKRAVVTTNVGAVPDYAVAGKTALVSEPNDVEGLAENIMRLVSDKNERERIAENGYNYTKEFTWERANDQLERVFKQCIQ